jgi:hypothetical protein
MKEDLPGNKPELVELHHDDWGDALTFWKWQHVGHGLYRWKCIGVEFSMFCPVEEQELLLAWLKPG